MSRVFLLCCAVLIAAASVGISGQSATDAGARLGYPDYVFYNGKVVTVDDESFTSNVGTIAQAIAVRGDTILAVGKDAEVRAYAGPQTKQIDLKGRTVLPSFILSHEHPTDWVWMHPESLKRVLPDGNPHLVHRFLKGTGEEQIANWEKELREAVAAAKPGQWILLSSYWGGNFEHMDVLWEGFLKNVSREKLDQIAPNNPVRVKNDWIDGVLNSRAIEEVKKVFPEAELGGRGNRGVTGRQLEPDVIFHGKNDILAELLKAEMELWVAHGVTVFGSSPYTAGNLRAFNTLDRRGEMPARFAWSYSGPDLHPDTLRIVAGLLGNGSKYLWNIGAQGVQSGGSCTTIEASAKVKSQEDCAFNPGSPARKVLEDIVRSGGRIAAMHSGGDKDIDNLMDAIEKASKEAGYTPEQVAAKRHAFDHASGAPRPDQIPRVKRLGMMVSMINTVLWENRTDYDISFRVRDYGIEYARWAVPRKSVTEAGIMNTQEIDRQLPHYLFFNVYTGMTRYNPGEKRTFAPQEGTDRVTQLKALTTWGSYYVLRENQLGSLEKGKLADLVVLDRDYLTVPEKEIPNLRVLMTVVGGKINHLLPELASEIGLKPAGPAAWPTRPLENHFRFRGPGSATN